MIAFGTAISKPATYEAIAVPGIERASEPDSAVLTRSGYDSIQQPYNEMMDEAAALPDLEALVLLHQDLELSDASLPSRVRPLFEDPSVGLVGSLGGCASRLHRWLGPDVAYGTLDPYGEPVSGSVEVEAVDGGLLVLAPWAVRSVRFGAGLARCFHGYDVDISLRVRAQGGKVICHHIPCFHRRSASEDYEGQREAGIALAQMWDPALRPRAWRAAFQR